MYKGLTQGRTLKTTTTTTKILKEHTITERERRGSIEKLLTDVTVTYGCDYYY